MRWLLVAVVGLAACGSSSTPATTGGHPAVEYASLVAEAKVDFATLDDPADCDQGGVAGCDALVVKLTRDERYDDRIGTLTAALTAIGRPAEKVRGLVSSTVSRLTKIEDTGDTWTLCLKNAGTLEDCLGESAAFDAARQDLGRVFASWQPYL